MLQKRFQANFAIPGKEGEIKIRKARKKNLKNPYEMYDLIFCAELSGSMISMVKTSAASSRPSKLCSKIFV
jgi:hypothetical protein